MCAPAGGRAGRGGRGPSERGREEAGRVWGERTSQARGLSDGVHGQGASGAGQCQAAQQGARGVGRWRRPWTPKPWAHIQTGRDG